MTIFNKRRAVKDMHFKLYEEDCVAIQEAATSRHIPVVTLVRQILLEWLKQNASRTGKEDR